MAHYYHYYFIFPSLQHSRASESQRSKKQKAYEININKSAGPSNQHHHHHHHHHHLQQQQQQQQQKQQQDLLSRMVKKEREWREVGRKGDKQKDEETALMVVNGRKEIDR
ncbi:hypothetical protein M0804_004804 [Polistes exclamans]|nr:hypothetical protein M0804_004804 [Polistes exclamans]